MLTMGLGGGVSIQAQGWVWGASGKPGGCKGGGGPAKGLLGSSGQCFLQAPGTASQAAPPYPPACLHSTSLHPWPGAISEAEGPAGATGAWLILMRGPQPKAPACSWSSFTWGRMTSRCCDWPRTCSLRHCLVPGNPAWLHRWLLPGLPRPAPPSPAQPRTPSLWRGPGGGAAQSCTLRGHLHSRALRAGPASLALGPGQRPSLAS